VCLAPLVSIILPVYNSARSLPACLDSLFEQTWPQLEILAVNDGSTDESAAILASYAKKHANLQVFTQANSGVSAARNLALSKAQGQFIRFVDSDDTLPPDSTANLIAAIEASHADLAIGAYTEVAGPYNHCHDRIRNGGTLSQIEFLHKYRTFPNSFYYSALWNKLYRRELLERNGLAFDPTMNWSEDFVFNAACYGAMETVALIENSVYNYHRNPGGLTFRFTYNCLKHPIQSTRAKINLYRHYKDPFIKTGIYNDHKWSIRASFVKPSLGE